MNYAIYFKNRYKLGVALRLVPVSGAERLVVLENNQADATIATLIINDKRKERIDFSIPYFRTGTTFVAPRDKKLNSREEFINSGLTYGIINGTLSYDLLKDKYPNVKLKVYNDLQPMFDDGMAGKIDGAIQLRHFLIAKLIEIPEISERIKYRVSRVNLNDDEELFGVGIPKGEDNLREAINKALVEMEELGEAQAIYNRWFGYKSDNPILRSFRIGENN